MNGPVTDSPETRLSLENARVAFDALVHDPPIIEIATNKFTQKYGYLGVQHANDADA